MMARLHRAAGTRPLVGRVHAAALLVACLLATLAGPVHRAADAWSHGAHDGGHESGPALVASCPDGCPAPDHDHHRHHHERCLTCRTGAPAFLPALAAPLAVAETTERLVAAPGRTGGREERDAPCARGPPRGGLPFIA